MNDPAGTQEVDELDQLATGVGHVCIAASMLEAELAFLAMTLGHWTDDHYRRMLKHIGGALSSYKDLVPRLEAWLGSPRQAPRGRRQAPQVRQL